MREPITVHKVEICFLDNYWFPQIILNSFEFVTLKVVYLIAKQINIMEYDVTTEITFRIELTATHETLLNFSRLFN